MEERKSILEELQTASPLESAKLLQEIELYDAKSSQEIIDEVYKEFAGNQQKVENIVVPVFTSIADGFLKKGKVGEALKKKGLTATRIVSECQNFTYDEGVDTYSEIIKDRVISENSKNQKSFNDRIDSDITQEYDREGSKYGYTASEHDKYFDKKFGDNKTIKDEYSNETIYRSKEQRDNRRDENDFMYQAELDHIVPLEKVHEQLKNNCLLTDEDVRRIANDESNYAVTSHKINNKKRSDYNEDFAESKKADDLGLDEQTRETMKQKGREAQKQIDKHANRAVLEHLKNGDKKDELKTAAKQMTGEAAKESGEMFIGTIIMEVIKPVYFEMKDCIVNGIKEPVGVDDLGGALAYRLSRVKNHVVSNLTRIGIDGFTDLIKSIVSSLVQGIVNLFFGMLKTFLQIIKDGIGIAISAVKILSSKEISTAEKGDAVVKLVGGALIGILGDVLVDKLNIPEPWETIVSALISGCGVLFFMILLDKIDIFSVKSERRRNRIIEIFNERIKDIERAKEQVDVFALETLKQQRENFEVINDEMQEGIKNNNIDIINAGLYKMAKYFKIELPYSDTDEFIEYSDTRPVIEL